MPDDPPITCPKQKTSEQPVGQGQVGSLKYDAAQPNILKQRVLSPLRTTCVVNQEFKACKERAKPKIKLSMKNPITYREDPLVPV